jgi:hypothetical protein
MLEFKVENTNGTTAAYTPEDIFGQLTGAGERPVRVSPDGQTITLSDSKGEFDVRTADILDNYGWKVNSVNPQSPIEDFVKPEFRVAVANLGGDDEVKKLYLREKMQEMGLKDANIVGQGTDFYVFHPESNSYYALTNKSGMDMSDIASGLSQAPGFIGGAVGGMAGLAAGLGVGSIPAAVAGGAGGQILGDVASRGAIAAYDPTFRKVAAANLGAQARDIGGNAAISGVTGGAFKALPMVAGAIRGTGSQAPGLVRGMLNSGPASSLARGAGALAEESGRLGATLSKPFMAKGVATDLATTQLPVAAPLQTAGVLMQAPGGITRGVANLYSKFGGQAGERFGASVSRDQAGKMALPELGEKVGQSIGRTMAKREPLSQAGRNFYKAARKGGSTAEEALNLARVPRVATYSQTGKKAGEGLQKMSAYGEKLDNAASGITRGLANATYAGGRGLQGVGAAVNRTARFAQPLENRLYSKMGAEEFSPRAESEYERYLRQRRNQVQSTPVFAQNQ